MMATPGETLRQIPFSPSFIAQVATLILRTVSSLKAHCPAFLLC